MKARDPVCGQELDLSEVAAHADHEGWAYFFCSETCRRQFHEAPARYVARMPLGRAPATPSFGSGPR